MATRIEQILLRARDTLADPNGERWSDSRLIRLLDEGQQDVAKHTKILKGETDIFVVEGKAMYTLPSDVWLITRAAFEGCHIDFHSHAQLDELIQTKALGSSRECYSTFDTGKYCWETDVGPKVQALVFDRRNMDEIRVYPIPGEDPITNTYTFETANPEYHGAALLGVVTDVTDYTFDSVFGVVVDMYDPQVTEENFIDTYGVLTSATESQTTFHIWYIRTPTPVTDVGDELEIPSTFDAALKHYVVSNAFDDDYDTRFAEKAAKAAALYERELGIIRDTQEKDGIRNQQARTTSYQGAFS